MCWSSNGRSSNGRSSSSSSTGGGAFAPLLRRCAEERAIVQGQHAHHCILITGQLERNTFLANLVLRMYAACGLLADATALFDRMHHSLRNEFTWRIIIVAYARSEPHSSGSGYGDGYGYGYGREMAFRLFREMQAMAVAVLPDRLTLITLIALCSEPPTELAFLSAGHTVHYLALVRSFDPDLVLSNALISMYAKHRCLRDARGVFDHMPRRDVVSWNALIAAYSREGQWAEAMEAFERMMMGTAAMQESFTPDRLTFIAILTALAAPSALEDGVRVHDLVRKSACKHDVAVNNALLRMYGKCGNTDAALRTFDGMVERDIITWTTVLALHAERQDSAEEAFRCYEQLQQECMAPNIVTSIKYLDACAGRDALCAGKRMHARVVCYEERSEVVTQTALISMYGRCASLESACAMFCSMPRRNTVTWGAMVAIHAWHGRAKEALRLFEQMQQEGNVPDRGVFVSIVEACVYAPGIREAQQVHARIHELFDEPLCAALAKTYAKHKCVESAEAVFNAMPERGVLVWNLKIAGCEENQMALEFFRCMQREAVMPDKVSFVSFLAACGAAMDLESGRQIHALLTLNSKFQSDLFLWNALVSMYGRCGDLEEAHRVFDRIPEKNDVSWNALMTAYAQNGHSKESLHIFHQMETQVTKNLGSTTFSVLLSACSHGGLVSEAFCYFLFMVQGLAIEPVVDHYNCMLDLLARAGLLDQAEILLENMPCTPNIISLATTLGGCRVLNDIERGECITMHMFHLDPCNAIPFVMLSNIYASAESHAGGVAGMLAYMEGIT